jgi:uncharacterized protein YlxP (DUF503 family)
MLCYDTLVLIVCVCNLATEICRLSGKSIPLPDFNAILRDPLSFSKCVKVLNTVRNAPALMNNKIKTKRQECKLLLQDLKASFNLSVAGTAVVHDRMTMEALYVGYLMGLEHTSKASRYLANLRNLLPTSGNDAADAPLQAEYYRLLSAYLVRCRYSLPEAPVVVAVRGSIWTDVAASRSRELAGGVCSGHGGCAVCADRQCADEAVRLSLPHNAGAVTANVLQPVCAVSHGHPGRRSLR